jgi:hypothetical protein
MTRYRYVVRTLAGEEILRYEFNRRREKWFATAVAAAGFRLPLDQFGGWLSRREARADLKHWRGVPWVSVAAEAVPRLRERVSGERGYLETRYAR